VHSMPADGVTIPGGWRDVTRQERLYLASKLGDKPIGSGEETNAAIEAEAKALMTLN
jgi:hypothetical protein